MPDRIVSDKKLSTITFKLIVEVPFSLSTTKSQAEEFRNAVKDNNLDVSKKIREIIYKKLGIYNKKEYDDLMENVINLAREEVYTRLKVDKNHSFSLILEEEINKFIKVTKTKDVKNAETGD